jgi:hypothetical protein
MVGHEAVRNIFKGKLLGALLKPLMYLPDDIVRFEDARAKSGANR